MVLIPPVGIRYLADMVPPRFNPIFTGKHAVDIPVERMGSEKEYKFRTDVINCLDSFGFFIKSDYMYFTVSK